MKRHPNYVDYFFYIWALLLIVALYLPNRALLRINAVIMMKKLRHQDWLKQQWKK